MMRICMLKNRNKLINRLDDNKLHNLNNKLKSLEFKKNSMQSYC